MNPYVGPGFQQNQMPGGPPPPMPGPPLNQGPPPPPQQGGPVRPTPAAPEPGMMNEGPNYANPGIGGPAPMPPMGGGLNMPPAPPANNAFMSSVVNGPPPEISPFVQSSLLKRGPQPMAGVGAPHGQPPMNVPPNAFTHDGIA